MAAHPAITAYSINFNGEHIDDCRTQRFRPLTTRFMKRDITIVMLPSDLMECCQEVFPRSNPNWTVEGVAVSGAYESREDVQKIQETPCPSCTFPVRCIIEFSLSVSSPEHEITAQAS